MQTIRTDIEAVPDGAHTAGLKSVLHHIEIAYRHLARGQTDGEDSAFNDAIYRTNQAFEGSVKEAYRVLAEKEPGGKTPATIERYLEQNKIFKDRILAQLKDYRTNWRNPSTHDYNLFFDQDEAFLAIISVSAFAKLLVRQISGHLSFKETREIFQEAAVKSPPPPKIRNPDDDKAATLSRWVKRIILDFFNNSTKPPMPELNAEARAETRLVGALAGYISAVLPELKVAVDINVGVGRNRVDLIVMEGDTPVFVEFKRWHYGESWRDAGVAQMMIYLQEASVQQGIVVFYDTKETVYTEVGGFGTGEKTVGVIAPVIDLR